MMILSCLKWKLEYLFTSNDYTISRISRPLLTCDSEDFRIKTNPFHDNILIAYNDNDYNLKDTTKSYLSISIHSRKETKSVNLFVNEDLLINDNIDIDTAPYIDFLINNATINSSKHGVTQYFCTTYNFTKDINISRVELIQGSDDNIVHHISFLLCEDEQGLANALNEYDITFKDTSQAHLCYGDSSEYAHDYSMLCSTQFVLIQHD